MLTLVLCMCVARALSETAKIFQTMFVFLFFSFSRFFFSGIRLPAIRENSRKTHRQRKGRRVICHCVRCECVCAVHMESIYTHTIALMAIKDETKSDNYREFYARHSFDDAPILSISIVILSHSFHFFYYFCRGILCCESDFGFGVAEHAMPSAITHH